MSAVDGFIGVVILISALMSIKRGFVREVLSLLIWLLAFAAAIVLHKQLAPLLADYISIPSLRNIAAMLILFSATLILGGVASYFLGGLIKATGLTSTDRFLGMLFGALRGILIVALCVMFSKKIFAEDPWWQRSQLIPHFQALESWISESAAFLYDEVKERIFGLETIDIKKDTNLDSGTQEQSRETLPDINDV